MDLVDLHERFTKDLINEDELGAVIRGHIHFEALILLYLKKAFTAPKHLDKLRFSQRVNLAIELEVIPAHLKGPLIKVAEIRNTFAHNLEANITDDLVQELYSSFLLTDRSHIDVSMSRFAAMLKEAPFFTQLANKEKFVFMVAHLKHLLHEFYRTKEQKQINS